MISVYDFLDYRQYLKAFFDENRTRRHLSHRAVLQKMEISSSGFLSNIISGKRSLTIRQAEDLSRIFGHSETETKYFKLLVHFLRAKSIGEKNDFFEQLLAYRRPRMKTLEKETLSLFKKWYYVVIREMLAYYDFTDDYESLASRIDPPIKVTEAKEAISDLEKMGLIIKDDKGRYHQADAVLSTGDEVKSLHVVNFQMQMIDIAKRAIERFDKDDRDISGLTVALPYDKIEVVKNELRKVRKKILQIAEDSVHSDRIIRCNIQLFPLTRISQKRDS